MKHRSPLFTLAAVAVAFAIMFIVNMVAGPPGNSSTETAVPSAAQPPPRPAAGIISPTETGGPPSPSASKSIEDSKFPEKSRVRQAVPDGSAAIAVAVLGDQAAAYFCDGRNC